jgi:hypothetical protein
MLQILAVKNSNQSTRKELSVVTKQIEEDIKVMATIATSLKDIPSKRALRLHAQQMEDQLA